MRKKNGPVRWSDCKGELETAQRPWDVYNDAWKGEGEKANSDSAVWCNLCEKEYRLADSVWDDGRWWCAYYPGCKGWVEDTRVKKDPLHGS